MDLPEGMIGMDVPTQDYTVFETKGEMPQALLTTWQEIWQKDNTLQRRYT